MLLVSGIAYGQVDTSYIYNTTTPFGTLDIRLAKSATRYYYLQENRTISFRESAPGVKITKKNFGRDRRYPITNRFRDR